MMGNRIKCEIQDPTLLNLPYMSGINSFCEWATGVVLKRVYLNILSLCLFMELVKLRNQCNFRKMNYFYYLKNNQWIFINIINQCIQENNRAVQEKQKRTMITKRPSLKSNLLRQTTSIDITLPNLFLKKNELLIKCYKLQETFSMSESRNFHFIFSNKITTLLFLPTWKWYFKMI